MFIHWSLFLLCIINYLLYVYVIIIFIVTITKHTSQKQLKK